MIAYELLVDCDTEASSAHWEDNCTVVSQGVSLSVTLSNVEMLSRGLRIRAVNSVGASTASPLALAAATESTVAESSLSDDALGGISAAAAVIACIAALLIVAAVRRSRSGTPRPFEQIPVDGWELSRDHVVTQAEIGRGAFGIVYCGTAYGVGRSWRTSVVAIKQCSRRTVAETGPIIDELAALKHLSSPWHRNVSGIRKGRVREGKRVSECARARACVCVCVCVCVCGYVCLNIYRYAKSV